MWGGIHEFINVNDNDNVSHNSIFSLKSGRDSVLSLLYRLSIYVVSNDSTITFDYIIVNNHPVWLC